MLDQLRAAIQVASTVVEIPRQKAEQFAQSLAKRGDLKSSQISSLVEDIIKRSRENAQMVQTLVSSELRRQIKGLGLVTKDDLDRVSQKVFGLATKEDIDRLSKRIIALEGGTNPSGRAVRPKPKPTVRSAAKPKTSPPSSGSSS